MFRLPVDNTFATYTSCFIKRIQKRIHRFWPYFVTHLMSMFSFEKKRKDQREQKKKKEFLFIVTSSMTRLTNEKSRVFKMVFIASKTQQPLAHATSTMLDISIGLFTTNA
jgi:hypothetical protein